MKKKILAVLFLVISFSSYGQDKNVIWSIGKADNSAADLSLGPDRFRDFLSRDFGFEDKYFLINHSK